MCPLSEQGHQSSALRSWFVEVVSSAHTGSQTLRLRLKPKKRSFGKSYISKSIEKAKKMVSGRKSVQLRDMMLISNLSKVLFF